ncbi:hypothetical protein CPA45_06675 [Vreelandella nigrificans]|uniref:Uncharacterized protein n=1 Tax=Vreelandella nigrificans TaxID=2042704 RepID=A0A2A4HRH7_9GAMM|nr:hypothetical protein CPA45_06675 [Halomonas nigrificans]
MIISQQTLLDALRFIVSTKYEKATSKMGVDFDAKNQIEISVLSDTFIYPVRLVFFGRAST